MLLKQCQKEFLSKKLFFIFRRFFSIKLENSFWLKLFYNIEHKNLNKIYLIVIDNMLYF